MPERRETDAYLGSLPLRLTPNSPYRDRQELAHDLAAIVNAELQRLVAAGARFIQLDEPSYSYLPVEPHELAGVYNRAVQHVDAQLALHICFGNFHGRPRTSRNSIGRWRPALSRKTHRRTRWAYVASCSP